MNKREIKSTMKEVFGDSFNYKLNAVRGGSIGPMTVTEAHTNCTNQTIMALKIFFDKFNFIVDKTENDIVYLSDSEGNKIRLIQIWQPTYKRSEGYDPSYMTCYVKVVW